MTGAPINEGCVAGLTKTGCVGTESLAQNKLCLLYFIIFILKTEWHCEFK